LIWGVDFVVGVAGVFLVFELDVDGPAAEVKIVGRSFHETGDPRFERFHIASSGKWTNRRFMVASAFEIPRLFSHATVVKESRGRRNNQVRKNVDRLYADQGGKCFWCGRQCRRIKGNKQHLDSFTVDHLIPSSRGAETVAGNLKGACHECNSTRGVLESRVKFGVVREQQIRLEYLPVVFEEELPALMAALEREVA
jgi:5-methylcytosine-specific restriction endonuclease McrA